MRKLGINAGSVRGVPALESIPMIKNAGFEAVFTGYRGDEYTGLIADELAKYGMSYDTIHAPFKHINDIWKPGDDGEAVLAELIDCVDCCSKYGVPVLIVHLSSGIEAPCVNDIGHERFDRLVERAGEKGVKIAFENQRKIGNLSFVLELYDKLEQVGFCWDNGHEACFTPGREYMPLFGNKLCALHIHDNTCEFNKDLHLLPFDGKIDWNRFAEHLRKSEFGGTLMLEVLPKNSDRYEDVTPEEYYARAFERAVKLRALVDGE